MSDSNCIKIITNIERVFKHPLLGDIIYRPNTVMCLTKHEDDLEMVTLWGREVFESNEFNRYLGPVSVYELLKGDDWLFNDELLEWLRGMDKIVGD